MISGFTNSFAGLQRVGSSPAWQAERRRLLNWCWLAAAVMVSLALLVGWWSDLLQQLNLVATAVVVTIGLLCWLFVALGRVLPYRIQAVCFLAGVGLLGLQQLLTVGFAGQALLTLFVFVIMTFALFDLRLALVTLGVTAVALGVIGWLVDSGRFVFGADMSGLIVAVPNVWLVVVRYAASAVLVMLFGTRAVALVRQLLHTQEETAARHGRERQEIARQVAEQTRALRAAAEISRKLNTTRDRSRLFATLVNLVQEASEYYHVDLYELSEDRTQLRLVAATGQPGRLMLAQQFVVPVGEGVAGMTAARAAAVFLPNVNDSDIWRPNPLLPETQSEAAVPVLLEDQVWGVIDVQSNRTSGLDAGDTAFLESVANQLSVALRNTARYEMTQLQAEHERLLSQFGYQMQLAPDADSLLKLVARELAAGLRTDKVMVVADVGVAESSEAPRV